MTTPPSVSKPLLPRLRLVTTVFDYNKIYERKSTANNNNHNIHSISTCNIVYMYMYMYYVHVCTQVKLHVNARQTNC